MRPTCHVVHGWKSDGENSIDKIQPFFIGKKWWCREFNYGCNGPITGLWGARFLNKGRAKELANEARSGDIAIGHSNGCAILHLASHMGAPFKKLIYINPALDSDLAPGQGVEECHVWFSPSDKPVNIAKWMVGHLWGAMGSTGYEGPDERMKNHNKEHNYMKSSKEHSDVFRDDLLRYFGPIIAECGGTP